MYSSYISELRHLYCVYTVLHETSAHLSLSHIGHESYVIAYLESVWTPAYKAVVNMLAQVAHVAQLALLAAIQVDRRYQQTRH